MMAKGNPNFKSFDDSMPDVKSLISWFDTLRINLKKSFDTIFYKQCPPWEVGEWEKREFRDFKIELDKIDRLYHVRNETDSDPIRYFNIYKFCIYCRMDYKGRALYFYLRTKSCMPTRGRPMCSYVHKVVLYLTFNVEVFVKAVVGEVYDRQKIWKSMVEDGVVMENPYVKEKEIPTLKLLCHMAIFDNQKELKHYPEVLPYCMTNSVNQYIKIRKTQDHDKYDFEESDIYVYSYDDGGLVDPWSCCHRQDHHKFDLDESDTYGDCDFKDGGLRDTCNCCYRDDHAHKDHINKMSAYLDCYIEDRSFRDTCSCWHHNNFLAGI